MLNKESRVVFKETGYFSRNSLIKSFNMVVIDRFTYILRSTRLLRPFTKLYGVRPHSGHFEAIKYSIVSVPILKNDRKIFNKSELVSAALVELQRLCNLERYVFHVNENEIELQGLRENVEKAVKLLELNLLHIKCKKVNLTELEVLNKRNLFNIIEFKRSLNAIMSDLLSARQGIYKLEIKLNFCENEAALVELYLTFFSNFPELNSVDDNIYTELSQILVDNLSIIELDVTKYSNFILTKKWTDFEIENLRSKTVGKHVYYAFSNVNGHMAILFVGLKKYLDHLKARVEEFLSGNEVKTVKLDLGDDDVSSKLKIQNILLIFESLYF